MLRCWSRFLQSEYSRSSSPCCLRHHTSHAREGYVALTDEVAPLPISEVAMERTLPQPETSRRSTSQNEDLQQHTLQQALPVRAASQAASDLASGSHRVRTCRDCARGNTQAAAGADRGAATSPKVSSHCNDSDEMPYSTEVEVLRRKIRAGHVLYTSELLLLERVYAQRNQPSSSGLYNA